MRTVRFRNATGAPVTLMVEPWGSQEVILDGSECMVRYPPFDVSDDLSFTELHKGRIVFSCEGPDFEISIDGVVVLPLA
jgi:hypothetical protein